MSRFGTTCRLPKRLASDESLKFRGFLDARDDRNLTASGDGMGKDNLILAAKGIGKATSVGRFDRLGHRVVATRFVQDQYDPLSLMSNDNARRDNSAWASGGGGPACACASCPVTPRAGGSHTKQSVFEAIRQMSKLKCCRTTIWKPEAWRKGGGDTVSEQVHNIMNTRKLISESLGTEGTGWGHCSSRNATKVTRTEGVTVEGAQSTSFTMLWFAASLATFGKGGRGRGEGGWTWTKPCPRATLASMFPATLIWDSAVVVDRVQRTCLGT